VLAARKLLRRRGRDSSGTFLIEGLIQLQDALASGAEVVEVFLEDPADGTAEQLCLTHDVPCFHVDRDVARALSQTVTPPGIVTVVRSPGVALSHLATDADLVLLLAEVRDPGNAGTLIRSAAAAGADAVIFSTRAVDPLGSKTVRSAAGAIFRIPLILNLELEVAIRDLRRRGFTIVGTEAHAKLAPDRCDMTRPTAVLMGNEAQGMPAEVGSLVDVVVGIPMPGSAESLNVGVAGSILLFEAVRQRRGHRTEAER
jgi:RNA methyltransferase, TrmH family